MSDLYSIRRENLRALITKHGNGEIAAAAGYPTPSYLSQMVGTKSNRGVTEKTARRIEEALRLPVHWLDQERDAFGKPVGKTIIPTSLVVESTLPVKKVPLSIVDPEHFADCAYIVCAAMTKYNTKLPKDKFAKVVGMLINSADQSDSAQQNLAETLVSLSM